MVKMEEGKFVEMVKQGMLKKWLHCIKFLQCCVIVKSFLLCNFMLIMTILFVICIVCRKSSWRSED